MDTKDFDSAALVQRNDPNTEKIETGIWHEIARSDNPFAVEKDLCFGYDHLELVQNRKYSDILYLLFTSELPPPDKSELFETLLGLLVSPGPRHAATRAVMSASASQTQREHILPLGMQIMGGDHLAGKEVFRAAKFIEQNIGNCPKRTAIKQLELYLDNNESIAPGFGQYNGATHHACITKAAFVCQLPGADKFLQWSAKFTAHLEQHDFSWLYPGLTAACLLDLNIPKTFAISFFQFAGAPGLIAHGIEMQQKSISDIPFIKDKNYQFE